MDKKTKEQFLSELSVIEKLEKKKYTTDKKLDRKQDALGIELKTRYIELSKDSFALVKNFDLNTELNLILRAAMLDERKLIKVSKITGEDIISDDYCISRTHGFKRYRYWTSSHFLGRESLISIAENGDLHVDRSTYGFSVLKNNSLVDQNRIEAFFNYLKRAVRLTRYFARTVKKTKTDNEKLLDDMKTVGGLNHIDEVEDFKKHIDHLEDYDQVYEALVSGTVKFDKRQDKLLADLKEYNQPYRTLLKLKD